MKNLLNTIKSDIKAMHNDVEFVRVISVYGYVIIGATSMLIGLVIGSNS